MTPDYTIGRNGIPVLNREHGRSRIDSHEMLPLCLHSQAHCIARNLKQISTVQAAYLIFFLLHAFEYFKKFATADSQQMTNP